MDLVQDHQTTEGSELESGRRQPGEIDRVLQVEPGHGPLVRIRQLPGEGGLTNLSRAKEGYDRELVQQKPNSGQVLLTGDNHH